MATDLKSHAQGVDLTRFWGGDRKGSSVQITMQRDHKEERGPADNFFDSIQLTRAQAAALAKDLEDFAAGREEEQI